MQVDMPLPQLLEYKPAPQRTEDFDAFWAQTLTEAGQTSLEPEITRIDYPVEKVTVSRVTFNGFKGTTRVHCWYLVPEESLRRSTNGRTPALVAYHGYSGSKGQPTSYLHWALQGYIVLAVDTRGQNGDTPDNATYTSGHAIGCMTKGILDPYEYFYRNAYMDCVRAVDFLSERPEVDPQKIVATGGSQGGGLALAVAALSDKVAAAMPDVPYLCHFPRAVEMFSAGPYQELVNYFKAYPARIEISYRTLSYFDNLSLCDRITCPTLISIAGQDTICPPSTDFAVYNNLTCHKELRFYRYNGHEGGGPAQEEEKYLFIRAQVG